VEQRNDAYGAIFDHIFYVVLMEFWALWVKYIYSIVKHNKHLQYEFTTTDNEVIVCTLFPKISNKLLVYQLFCLARY